MWHAGSDVMGCRRPTGGVFSYVSSDRVTLRAFPVATPRGRSSSSHEGEQHVPACYCQKNRYRLKAVTINILSDVKNTKPLLLLQNASLTEMDDTTKTLDDMKYLLLIQHLGNKIWKHQMCFFFPGC